MRNINLKFFAAFREVIGQGELLWPLPDNEQQATANFVLLALVEEYPLLAGASKATRVMVNRQYADLTTVLKAGDEVAFIPPVGGGSDMPIIKITTRPIDVPSLIEKVSANPANGGLVTFVGAVRRQNDGHAVTWLEYEAYAEAAEEVMRGIAQEVQKRWQTSDIAMVHRIGHLEVGEIAVAVVVATPHRGEAFDACEYAIDALKADVPIWKKESYEDISRPAGWVKNAENPDA